MDKAASFKHSGIVSVFLTALLLYIFRYSKVSQATKFINSPLERGISSALEGWEFPAFLFHIHKGQERGHPLPL